MFGMGRGYRSRSAQCGRTGAARRLRAVIDHPSPAALPLARLVGHTADAVQAVRAGRSLNDALARCPAEARPGTQALSFHVLRWLGSAQVLRALLAPKQPPPAVDALLLTALALAWPPATPPYAEHTLVDQTVGAARRRVPASAAFVNAVLRRFLRERDGLVERVLRDPLARHNHPAWWVERLQRDWPERWAEVLDANQQHPPMTLRVNARRSSAAVYVERLAAAGIAAHALQGHAVQLAEACPVTRLPGFAAGDVSVQDAAAQRAAPLLLNPGLAPGAHVLDACAAPGGKTAQLLELAELDLLALDSDAARLVRVDETLARLGLAARTRAADAADTAAWWDGRPFDAILLDAPCSASGIVRRHPDVRWLRRPGDIDTLARTQARLLDALWPLLCVGGRLLYCSCSVFRAEGQDQIDAFLQRQAGARVAASPPSPGHLLPLPHNGAERSPAGPNTAADGFFYTLIEKQPA
jgi:16S rRNA (cytosine967-C5)-methyltransferase